jgi:hypothetical protein
MTETVNKTLPTLRTPVELVGVVVVLPPVLLLLVLLPLPPPEASHFPDLKVLVLVLQVPVAHAAVPHFVQVATSPVT